MTMIACLLATNSATAFYFVFFSIPMNIYFAKLIESGNELIAIFEHRSRKIYKLIKKNAKNIFKETFYRILFFRIYIRRIF